jgi:hypothetical protein
MPMTVLDQANAAGMAETFAEAVRGEPAARTLYFRQWGLVSEFWLVTDPIDLETERRLRQVSNLLYQKFQDALIDFQILNPEILGATEPEAFIPTGASQQMLH